MLRSSAAIASRMLRLVAASSRRPILCHRAIAASPDSSKNKVAFAFCDPLTPRFPSPADQSRGYARGRPVISEDDDDDEFEDEFDSNVEITDSEIEDDDVFDVDEDEDEDEDEEGDGQTNRRRK